MKKSVLNTINSLICYWDFSGEYPLVSKGPHQYKLQEGNGEVKILHEGPVSGHSAKFEEGQYLYIPRTECPALNICGKNAQVTILAWIKRDKKSYIQCEAIAGMWNETEKKRQYCMFLNLRLFDSADQVCGHISSVGGPTKGEKWCIDASKGQKSVPYNEWQFIGFTYNGEEIISYLNGRPDYRANHSPYHYTEGVFETGTGGSDFTVAAVHRLGEMGNNFVGLISGLAIYNSALTKQEIYRIYQNGNVNTL